MLLRLSIDYILKKSRQCHFFQKTQLSFSITFSLIKVKQLILVEENSVLLVCCGSKITKLYKKYDFCQNFDVAFTWVVGWIVFCCLVNTYIECICYECSCLLTFLRETSFIAYFLSRLTSILILPICKLVIIWCFWTLYISFKLLLKCLLVKVSSFKFSKILLFTVRIFQGDHKNLKKNLCPSKLPKMKSFLWKYQV